MPNSYSQIFIHIVFSTKNRKDFITPDIEQRVWAYMGGIAKAHNMIPVQIGGIDNHTHSLINPGVTKSIAEAARCLKSDSSKWISDEFPHLRHFAWQRGYAAFSVSKSAVPDVVSYIKNQREHHTKQSFEDEYRSILDLHGVDYDEQYLFDD